MAVDTIERARTDENRGKPARLATIDTDVHHGIRKKAQLYPYLTKIYAERFADYGVGASNPYAHNGGVRGYRADVVEVHGKGFGVVASNVEATRTQLLDECAVDLAILSGGSVYSACALTDLDYASAICRAFNDFTIEHWLAADPRFRFAMAVCPQDPQQAAAEIDRIGGHPGVVAVLLPCGAPRAFGQRFYHPIFEACARHGLTVALHFATEGNGVNPPPTAAGFPTYYVESRQARPSFYQAHLASLVFEGWFEKFPTLKVAMLEAGFAWVAPYLWKMDQDWKGLRWQTPWVKRPPSEYVRERVWFATQPIEEPDPPEALLPLIEWMGGARTLMFASDYPHWDWDDPRQTFTHLPAELRRRIFVENALEAFPLENV